MAQKVEQLSTNMQAGGLILNPCSICVEVSLGKMLTAKWLRIFLPLVWVFMRMLIVLDEQVAPCTVLSVTSSL